MIPIFGSHVSKYLLLVDESSTLAVFQQGVSLKEKLRSPVKPQEKELQEKEINRDKKTSLESLSILLNYSKCVNKY